MEADVMETEIEIDQTLALLIRTFVEDFRGGKNVEEKRARKLFKKIGDKRLDPRTTVQLHRTRHQLFGFDWFDERAAEIYEAASVTASDCSGRVLSEREESLILAGWSRCHALALTIGAIAFPVETKMHHRDMVKNFVFYRLLPEIMEAVKEGRESDLNADQACYLDGIRTGKTVGQMLPDISDDISDDIEDEDDDVV